MKKIAVVYHSYPHYRKAIVEALDRSKNYRYIFIGSADPVNLSIKNMEFPEDITLYDAPCRKVGPFLFQKNINTILNENKVDGVILLGNVWYLSYWILCLRLKLQKKPIWMWTHGWINKDENGVKKNFRNLFYKLADGLLLYGNRAKEIGILNGFDSNKLHVIGNSLDYVGMSKLFDSVVDLDRKNLKIAMELPTKKSIIVCSARLTALCQFDLLIEAVSIINSSEKSKSFTVVLIGDGSEKETLQRLASKLGVDIRFVGACYDEEVLAKYYHLSDMSVSPGKVGLTAMHSMTYGTPVISHNNLDKQMPEVEAIKPGITGALFEYGSAQSLADEIVKWHDCKNNNLKVIKQCRDIIFSDFSPAAQVRFIEEALSKYWENK